MTLHQADGLEINFLTPEEIEAWGPDTQLPDSDGRHERLRGCEEIHYRFQIPMRG
ncbi:MAG: hypothetical protein ACREXY_29020 [Gammaproteobacteria bacterium]